MFTFAKRMATFLNRLLPSSLACWMALSPLLLMDCLVQAQPAQSSNVAKGAKSGHTKIELPASKSRVQKYANKVTRISVADPGIADVMLINEFEVYLLGKKAGVTNVYMWHEDDRVSVIDLIVGADVSAIQNAIGQLMPEETNVRVTSAGDSVVLSGKLSSAAKVQQAVQIAEQMSEKKVMNMLSTDFLPQVMIEVKIAEIDKQIADQLGLQVSGSTFAFGAAGIASMGGAANAMFTIGTTRSWIQAQVNSGLIKILAEPNIMAISGQEGNFLAGGIVFIPVPQSSATGGGAVITLQQQPYGVGLKFTPTVLEGNRINLSVRPEVSEVSPNGITVSAGNNQLVMPVIMTRAASTTVQLMDGQTFAIGGLISNTVTQTISAFPWLGNVPILGALFRSSTFQNNRSELIILVTPHIVNPMNQRPALPTDSYIQPTESEFFLQGKMQGSPPISNTSSGASVAADNGGRNDTFNVTRDYGY